MPVPLKDGIDVAGLQNWYSRRQPFGIADTDAAVTAARCCSAAGAIVSESPAMPPFLAGYQSADPIFGLHVELVGSRARLAGRSRLWYGRGNRRRHVTSLKITSDLAGSARLPARCCGVYGQS